MASFDYTNTQIRSPRGFPEDEQEYLRLINEAPTRVALGGVEVVDTSYIWEGLPLGAWEPRSELLAEIGLK
jgi:hypothetical protein